MLFNIDVKEDKWSPKVLSNLLIDRTTNNNIFWATSEYEKLGVKFNERSHITPELVIKNNIIQPRVLKSKQTKSTRTKGKAEVFTPSWLCNEQNNMIDENWFGRKNIFNIPKNGGWITNTHKIKFYDEKKWKLYIKERRLEVSCGEAPYLVSRYDTVTGKVIDLENRIGLLDRKIRIVNENTFTYQEWFNWVVKAFQSIYGFEFQGDSLLLARENLLISFCDYVRHRFKRLASEEELLIISNIISWNIWQMDGLTCTIPFKETKIQSKQLSFFEEYEEQNEDSIIYCLIRDWETMKDMAFIDLTKEV